MARVVMNKAVANKQLERAHRKLVAVGYLMETAVKRSMVEGTGREYKRGSKIHVASAEGNPPAVDTGRLRASISTNWTKSGMSRGKVDPEAEVGDGVGAGGGGDRFVVTVGTNVTYGPLLEFGTSKMGPRPFIRPVFDQFKNKIAKLVATVTVRKI